MTYLVKKTILAHFLAQKTPWYIKQNLKKYTSFHKIQKWGSEKRTPYPLVGVLKISKPVLIFLP
jgi:hypothetical protein